MAMIQTDSGAFDRLDEARSAVVAVRLAELMGLYRRDPGAPIDQRLVEDLAERVATAGIGERPALGARLRRRRGLATRVLDGLEASPLPTAEIPALARILGVERLAALSGASQPSLRRYAVGERITPDAVAQRLHFVALLVALLRGSYNEFGVRRWLARRRTQLDGRAPADLLVGAWDPDDPGPGSVRRLAEALLA